MTVLTTEKAQEVALLKKYHPMLKSWEKTVLFLR